MEVNSRKAGLMVPPDNQNGCVCYMIQGEAMLADSCQDILVNCVSNKDLVEVHQTNLYVQGKRNSIYIIGHRSLPHRFLKQVIFAECKTRKVENRLPFGHILHILF